MTGREALTRGRKMIDTISSSFSVRAIAKPPSRGTMMPARNAPKIACTCSYTSALLPCIEREETHAYNIGEKGGPKEEKNRDCHEEHRRAVSN